MRLTTKRLVLALAAPSDARAWLDYAIRNFESHRPWSPPAPKDAFTLGIARQRIRAAKAEFEQRRRVALWLRLKRSPRGPFVGAITLSGIQFGAFRSATVGYHLDHECVGQGLMSEALARVITYAFDELRLHRLEGNFVPTNERSARVLERAGFEVEGYARKYLFIGGAWRDHVLTALRNPTVEDPEAFALLD